MKEYKMVAFLIAIFTLGVVSAYGQYDDLYYNPDTDARQVKYDKNNSNTELADYGDNKAYASNGNYDDDAYDYYYTSRIRRFHRPVYGFGYFDPVYTDLYYYDPAFVPGPSTVLIYDSPYSYNSWARWNAFNRAFYNPYRYAYRPGYPYWDPYGPGFFGPAFGSGFGLGFGVGSAFGAYPGFSPYSGFYGGGFYGGGFYGGGYGSALYCPPSYYGGNSYNTVNGANTAVTNTANRPRNSAGTVSTAPRTGTETTGTSRSSLYQGSRRTNPAGVDSGVNQRNTRTRSVDSVRDRFGNGSSRNYGTQERSTITSPRTRSFTTPSSRGSSINRSGSTAPSRSFSTPSQSRSFTPSQSRSFTPSSSGSSPSPSRSSSGSSRSGRGNNE